MTTIEKSAANNSTSNSTEMNKTKKKDVLLIDPRSIIVDGFNPRNDMGDIDGLMESILENGVEVPLTGYKQGENYVVIAGHRRHTAVMQAISLGHDIARIPMIAKRKPTMEQMLFDTLLTNDGKSMTPLELGETYKRILAFGLNINEIANKLGKTHRHVSEMILVASSSTDVKQLIKDNVISASLVAEISTKVKDVAETEQIIKDAVKKTPGKKVTKKVVQTVTDKITKSIFTRDEVLDLLERQRSACAESVSVDVDRELVLKTALVVLEAEKEEKVEA